VIHARVDQAHEWDVACGQGVSDRGLAAGRVPAKQAFRCEAHAGEMLGTFRDLEARRGHLEDVGTPMCVEDRVRASEEVRERLAVVTVADDAIAAIAGNAACDPAQGTAETSDGQIGWHHESDRNQAAFSAKMSGKLVVRKQPRHL